MQFTGLKDKNGKEIYEEDVIKYGDRLAVVRFDNGGFGVAGETPDKDGIVFGQRFLFLDVLGDEGVEGTEIIGNIYENANLLTNEK
jgi:uncharacterized phage protein (TIGR01671 family)